MRTYFNGRCSKTATIPMPVATHPAPARNPAVAPKASVVVGALRNMARLNAITRLSRKAIVNPFGPAAGGSAVNPLACFHAETSRTGEYHNPPMTNAEMAAARMAQMFNVCMFMDSVSLLSLARGIAKHLLPVNGAVHEALVQRGHQLRIPGHQVFVAARPSRLGQADDGRVSATLKLERRPGTLGAHMRKLIGSQRRNHHLFFGNKAHDGSTARAAAGKVRCPLPARTQVHHRIGCQPRA